MTATRTPRDDALRKRLRSRYAALGLPCGICQNPIDYKIRHPDPYSACVDHITPLNKGGIDHADNCQPSHRACNRTKSDKVPGEKQATEQPRTYVTWRTW